MLCILWTERSHVRDFAIEHSKDNRIDIRPAKKLRCCCDYIDSNINSNRYIRDIEIPFGTSIYNQEKRN
jgi:hypothetical protein